MGCDNLFTTLASAADHSSILWDFFDHWSSVAEKGIFNFVVKNLFTYSMIPSPSKWMQIMSINFGVLCISFHENNTSLNSESINGLAPYTKG